MQNAPFRVLRALSVLLLIGTPAVARELSFEDRVNAQRAIEQVYWSHRIWPKENPAPKPTLSAVMGDDALRARVEDYLEESNALAELWGRPITAAQLQAEVERFAAQTHAPDVLRELFAALHDDPFLIAETLARQSLADRLIRSSYARDERFHGEMRRKAEKVLSGVSRPAQLKTLGAAYVETTWRRALPGGAPSRARTREIALDAAQWAELLERLPKTTIGPLQDEDGAFTITAVIRRSDDSVTTAAASWPKVAFDTWWSKQRQSETSGVVLPVGDYAHVNVDVSGTCIPDTWSPTVARAPEPRYNLTAVWTGSEMIVWGGYGYNGRVNSGGRYNPSTDTWLTTSLTGAPDPRDQHTAVWTGTRMVVWGGYTSPGVLTNTGGRYNPFTDSWSTTATGGAPSARFAHTAVWTGTYMIVWGGSNGSVGLGTGGRYNPSTGVWSSLTTVGAPSARAGQSAVWTGTEMIVWGGFGNTGGRYNPTTDSWVPTSTGTNVPAGRDYCSAVWTGSEMIVWGGGFNTGGRYNPSTDTWLPTSLIAAPSARSGNVVVWTGSAMIVWGGTGGLNNGGRYAPSTDTWLSTATSGAPRGRYSLGAVWTGSEMIVWGGQYNGPLGDGGRYNPSTDHWVPTTQGSSPPGRTEHSAVWTGSEMIVWGGVTSLNDGGRYDPSTDNWTPTTTVGAPAERYGHTATWTGSEMIIWGGNWPGSYDPGGRYNPTTNTWQTPSSTGVPPSGFGQSAVWTGSEMIVWGGNTNVGARYNPSSDTWASTSTVGAPAARYEHTAVWTGREMIIWGGVTNAYVNDGGRYDPATDSWQPTTVIGAPAIRREQVAVWTSSEMIVWGGEYGGHGLSDGGRYSPATDSWLAVAPVGPAGRYAHTAIWTGSELVVWGGKLSDQTGTTFNDGGRYSPVTDSWVAMSLLKAPSPREFHTAVWTGREMIVWGGDGDSIASFSDGGRYCVGSCAAPAIWYQDQDGDGRGTASLQQASCTQPAGFVAAAGDCDDTNAAVWGAPIEVATLTLSGIGSTDLTWPDQAALAGSGTSYDLVSGTIGPSGGLSSAGCLQSSMTVGFTDARTPAAGAGYWYLVRARNSCGSGTYGSQQRDSSVSACP